MDHLFGGQDQGVYITMSSYLEKNGGIQGQDEIRTFIKDTPELLSIYDEDNSRSGVKKKGKYEGTQLPGVYITDFSSSGFVFQFPPVLPAWMVLFSNWFGPGSEASSVTFFGVIAVVFIYLLLMETTGNFWFSFFAAVAVAIHPVPVFFSLFPLSESAGLFFMIGGYLFLIRAIRERENRKYMYLFFLVSLLSFQSFFLLRINAMFHLPVLAMSFLYFSTKENRIDLQIFNILIGVAFLFSSLFFYFQIYPYVFDQFNKITSGKFGPEFIFFPGVLYIVFIISIVFFTRIQRLNWIARFILRIKNNLRVEIGVIAFIFVLSILYKVYLVGWGMDQSFGNRFYQTGKGLETVKFIGFFLVIRMLTPVLAVGLLSAFVKKRKVFSDSFVNIALIALLYFSFIYMYAVSFFVGYMYYYSRYYLVEIFPLYIIVSVMGLVELSRVRHLKWPVYVAGPAYFISVIVGNSFLFQPNVGEGMRELISTISFSVRKHDLIFTDLDSRFITPLRFYYGNSVWKVPEKEKIDKIVATWGGEIFKNFDNVYSVSESQMVGEGWSPVREFRSDLKDLPCTMKPDCKVLEKHMYLYISKFDRERSVSGFLESGRELDISFVRKVFPSSGVFLDNNWTDGKALFNFNPVNVKRWKSVVIETYGNIPTHKASYEVLKPELFLDGRSAKYIKKNKNEYLFHIPSGLNHFQEMEIRSSTFVPAEEGINSDPRHLGMDLKTIRLY